MATAGKLEARVSIPTGGWDMTVTETGGGGASDTITIPAGEYYHSTVGDGSNDLPAEIAAQLNGSVTLNGTYTCTVGAGESGTGKYTMTVSGGGVTEMDVTAWDDTSLRDLLGYSGSEAAAATYTGDNHAKSLWLPTRGYFAEVDGEWDGIHESDLQTQTSMSGHHWAVSGRRRRVLAVRWNALAKEKVYVVAETVTGESFEQFWIDAIYGEAAHTAKPAGPIRLHRDADTDGTYSTFNLEGQAAPLWPRFNERNWNLYSVSLERMILEPS